MKLLRSKTFSLYLSLSVCMNLIAQSPDVISSLLPEQSSIQIEEALPLEETFAQIPEQKIIADLDDTSDEVDQAIDDDPNLDQDADLNPKALYDPNLYGTGASLPEKPVQDSKMRSIYAFLASIVIATAAVLVTGANGGKNAR